MCVEAQKCEHLSTLAYQRLAASFVLGNKDDDAVVASNRVTRCKRGNRTSVY